MRRLLALVVVLLVLAWLLIPPARALELVYLPGGGGPTSSGGLAVQSITFGATDGAVLHGWFVPAAHRSPAIVLVPGFKAARGTMVPHARFLHASGYAVLLYDSRGMGQSGGHFSVGLHEVDDVLGALRWLRGRGFQRAGLLGVSLGAGDAIVAAARDPHVRATVADSPYPDQRRTVDRLDALDGIPLAPLGPWTVDHLLGSRLSSFSPLRLARQISPRALLLIHARFDANPTTPLVGVLALYHACRSPCFLWLAPRGVHAGALAARPTEYQRRVLAFFRRYLGAAR